MHTGEAPGRGRPCHVDSEANGAHSGHCKYVQPCCLDPLTEGGTRVVWLGTVVTVMFLLSACSMLRVGVDRR
jgi:hypothetical protein